MSDNGGGQSPHRGKVKMSTSKFLYGIHEPGGEHILSGRGWVVFTELVSEGGKDYRRYADQGLGVIVRLNHSYGNGTLPPPSQYAQYAQDVATLVRNSRGCKIWIIGNEPNHHQEGAIAFDDYTDGFNQAANAIRRVQPDAIVCIAAVAPWNMDAGDWLFYFAQLVRLCNCDGITLHTYTHGVDPALVYSDEKMQSHPDRYYHFKAYRDFMSAIPGNKRHLPVYITETDQDVPWANVNSGWVRNAYAEINWWNEQPGNQQIRALVLYRWPNFDKWGFCDLAGVHDDLRAAVALGYQWREAQPQVLPAPADWHGYVTASPFLRLRAGPNTTSNVLAEIDTAEKVVVIGEQPDWLQVNYGGLGGWVSAKWVSRAKPTINNESTQDQRAAIITKLAAEYGVDERVAKAVIKIESGGSGFRNGRLIMRFEPHVFKARFSALFQEHFQMGDPAWNGDGHRVNVGGEWKTFHGNQDMEYQAQLIAADIAERAAFEAASYGAGQIMGFNHAACGYSSARVMAHEFQQSEEAQLRAMFQYFKHSGALACLVAGDLLGFAKIYNGPGQAQFYANKIREAMR